MTKGEIKYCYQAIKTSSNSVGYIDKLQVRFALAYIVAGSK